MQSDDVKKGKIAQIIAVIASLTLFSGYVVYSQLKQSGTVASSSKVMVLTNSRAVTAGKTNAALTSKQNTRAADSNTISQSILPRDTKSNTPPAKSQMVFPGSKSAAVFSPQQVQRSDSKTK